MELVKSPTVGNRRDLAKLCNTKHLVTAVEIGTDRGLFARDFLEVWNGEMLWCVDSWESYPEMPWNRAGDFEFAVHVLAPYAHRVRLMKATSIEAAHYFATLECLPKQVGLVYIDGAHDYDAVRKDLDAWWPLVQPNGILAGDDFDEVHPGVMNAVSDFAAKHEIGRIDLTTDYNRAPSWYIEKPVPEIG